MDEKNAMTNVMNLSEQMEEDRKIVSKNLLAISRYMGWSKADMALRTDVSGAAVSNYLSGERIPTVSYLKRLCILPEIRDRQLDLTVDKLLSEDFRLEPKKVVLPVSKDHAQNLQGRYMVYFLDQSKDLEKMEYDELGGLRVGILAIVEGISDLKGTSCLKVFAAFYKEEQEDVIERVRKDVDAIFSFKDTDANEIASRLQMYYENKPGDSSPYTGEMSVTQDHLFVSLNSEAYQDQALMIFSQPKAKREGKEYVGGMGAVASVCHGQVHKPTAQNIILSRYPLTRVHEQVRQLLWDFPTEPKCTLEAMEITRLAKHLFDGENAASTMLDDDDKAAILANRMDQLVKLYVQKRMGYVSCVAQKNEYEAYRIIMEQRKN